MERSSGLPRVGIIGAGPAGLTAAYLLSKKGAPVTVFDADPEYVGGISRTPRYKGFHFDIGGHRFFSKSQAIEDLWSEILPDDMLTRSRSSKICYRRKFFTYPLDAREALFKLGLLEAVRCAASYVKAKIRPMKDPRNLEEWVTKQFGSRLFAIFFKSYTEKVWGIDCRSISADWAAQRIKGLSLGVAIKNALMGNRAGDRSKVVKTLIDTFRYPRKGPGMLWEECAAKTCALGGVVRMGERVIRSRLRSDGTWQLTSLDRAQEKFEFEFEHVISTAPLRDLAEMLLPAPSSAALEAARNLKYRHFIIVVLISPAKPRVADNWIYIHEPSVKVGRVQNFKAWSPEMVPDPAYSSYGLEYFCFAGESLWSAGDSELIELATREIDQLGLVEAHDVIDGCVVRQPNAYPVYDKDYSKHVAAFRAEIERHYPRLYVAGRNGMHKYNNQDHAMMTAWLCVENILAGRNVYDVWKVNQDAEYIESGVTDEAPPT